MTINLYKELVSIVGDESRVSTGESILEQHSSDLTYHPRVRPDVVVFPISKEEVSLILQFANEHRIPVTPYGAGTSLEGHVIPVHGGISLNMMRMNQVVEVCPQDFLVRVQPGVTRVQLNKYLGPFGLQFPLDPGADASLGGMCATNASGTTAVRYGVMRQQVLDLEVVCADGSIIRTGGRAIKSSSGYNLTGLIVGSEGTLGVVTELTMRIYGIPEHTIAARAVFPSVEAACRAAYNMMGTGIPIGRVELVDEFTIAAFNRFKMTQYTEKPTLFLEFHGSKASAQGDVNLAEELCNGEGVVEFHYETNSEARHKLWEARHDAALVIAATAPGKKMKLTDVCIPISELPQAITHARETIDAHGIYGAILGHVGDGNYHVEFMVDPDNEEELRVAEKVNDEIVNYALQRGGTCTGEHGVGIGKKAFVKQEHASSYKFLQVVKRAFDPNGILNPGKVIDASTV